MPFYRVKKVRELEEVSYSFYVVGGEARACGEGEVTNSGSNSKYFYTHTSPNGREGFLMTINVTATAHGDEGGWGAQGNSSFSIVTNNNVTVGSGGAGSSNGDASRNYNYNIDSKSSETYQNVDYFTITGSWSGKATNHNPEYCIHGSGSISGYVTYLVYKDSQPTS